MRAHAKSIRNRLELFFLFVNAVPAAPEPRLVYEWPVRRVHQTDDSVVDMRRQFARQMRDLVLFAEHRQGRSRSNFFRQPRSRRVHVHPNIAIAFFAGIVPRENALYFQFVLARQRRNFHASCRARLKSPSMIAAFHRLPVKVPIRKRHPSVCARISHRKRFPLRSPIQNRLVGCQDPPHRPHIPSRVHLAGATLCHGPFTHPQPAPKHFATSPTTRALSILARASAPPPKQPSTFIKRATPPPQTPLAL